MDDGPSIQFPVDDYPIKVIAHSDAGLTATVVEIIRTHDAGFREESVTLQASREGKYTSVRLFIRATGEPQLKALHTELMSHPLVKLVL